MRATVSVALPGACGTISLIGLSGYCPCAPAADGSSAAQPSRTDRAQHSRPADRQHGTSLPKTFLVARSLAATAAFAQSPCRYGRAAPTQRSRAASSSTARSATPWSSVGAKAATVSGGERSGK